MSCTEQQQKTNRGANIEDTQGKTQTLNTGEYDLFVVMAYMVAKKRLNPEEIVNATGACLGVLDILTRIDCVLHERKENEEKIKKALRIASEAYDRSIKPEETWSAR